MENATKALLIAGAVIVVVILISIGMSVLNPAAEQVENVGSNLTELQVQQFNDKFRKYEGASVSGAEVNSLITTVFNHNNQQDDDTTCVAITGDVTCVAQTGLTTMPTKVSTGAKYSVTATYNANTGLITSLAVDQL